MVKQIRDIITEGERNEIRSMYGLTVESDIVILDWLSPDENYCIFLDELYDIQNKTKIGNIWENFDNFKFFLKHSFEVAKNIPQQIKEEVLISINNLILTEGNQNLSELKPFVKQMINENIFKDAWNWGKEQVKGAVKGVKDFAKTSWEGLKKTYNYIADGQWKEAFAIIGKGMLWVARKIRSALYHPVGLLLDAILIATGVGKGAQFVIWAVVVALDIYELMTGNYEEEMSMGWRLLFLGVDIIGLVFAGVAAKSAKGVVGGLIRKFGRTAEGLSNAVKGNKVIQGILEKILNASKGASATIQKAMSYLQKNAPKLYSFFSGIMSGLSKFLTMMVNAVQKLLNIGGKVISAPGKLVTKIAPQSTRGTKFVKGAAAAATAGVPILGIGAYSQGKKREYETAIETGLSNPSVESEYNYDDI
jgi:hypothetical protein